jgi:hypothetical protein
MIVVFGMMFLMFVFMFGFLLVAAESNSNEPPLAVFLIQFLFMGGIFCAMGLYPVIGIFAALLTFGGKNFRYPLLGNWIEKYLMDGNLVNGL